MKIYYGLSKEESKLSILTYEGKEGFTLKGVNTTLDGLKRFVKDNDLENIITYYTILDSSIFEIAEDVLYDCKYDMIAVKIPFSFEIKKVYKL